MNGLNEFDLACPLHQMNLFNSFVLRGEWVKGYWPGQLSFSLIHSIINQWNEIESMKPKKKVNWFVFLLINEGGRKWGWNGWELETKHITFYSVIWAARSMKEAAQSNHSAHFIPQLLHSFGFINWLKGCSSLAALSSFAEHYGRGRPITHQQKSERTAPPPN